MKGDVRGGQNEMTFKDGQHWAGEHTYTRILVTDCFSRRGNHENTHTRANFRRVHVCGEETVIIAKLVSIAV